MNWVWRSRNGKVRGLGGAALAGLASGPLSEWVVERPARWTPARELQVDSRQTFERQPRLPAERELLGPSNGGKSNARWCLDGPATHRRRFADFAGLLQVFAGIRRHSQALDEPDTRRQASEPEAEIVHPGTRPRARQSHDCAAHADYIFPTLSSVPGSNQGHARDARGGTSPRLGHRSAIEGPPTPAAIHPSTCVEAHHQRSIDVRVRRSRGAVLGPSPRWNHGAVPCCAQYPVPDNHVNARPTSNKRPHTNTRTHAHTHSLSRSAARFEQRATRSERRPTRAAMPLMSPTPSSHRSHRAHRLSRAAARHRDLHVALAH